MQKILKNGALFANVGEGYSGAKFTSLKEGADESIASGFRLKPRIELRTEIFNGFFRRSGMLSAYNDMAPFGKIEELSKSARWSSGEEQIFAQISEEYKGPGEPVLMGRANSRFLDAGGNGTLHSGAILNTPENIKMLVTEIALSFFCDKAREVRREAGLQNDELAAMVEPMVWERGGAIVTGYDEDPVTDDYVAKYGPMHAPRFSGVGKTKTPYGDARIGFVRGLAFHYMENPVKGISLTNDQQDMILDKLFLMRTMPLFRTGQESGGDVFEGNGLYMKTDGSIRHGAIYFSRRDLDTCKWTTTGLFKRLNDLKNRRGKEQYIEWSMVRDKQFKPIYYLNQRSDFEIPFFEISKNIVSELIIGKNGLVMGAGRKKIDYVARLGSGSDWTNLAQINSKYTDYAISFGQGSDETICPKTTSIKFENLSKSSCILCDVNNGGTMNILENHVGGAIGLTKKIVVAFDEFDWRTLARNSTFVETCGDISVFKTDLVLEASEKGQKAILYMGDGKPAV